MAEPIVARSDLIVASAEPVARLVLHCRPAHAAVVGEALGIELPPTPLRAARDGSWHTLHLAPDEWLLLGPPTEAAALMERTAGTTLPHALVDVTDRDVGIDIAGASARDLLAAGCPLDLDDARFPVDACSRTLFGKVTVLLWRTGRLAWRMHYARSFDDYVVRFVQTAAQDVPERRPQN